MPNTVSNKTVQSAYNAAQGRFVTTRIPEGTPTTNEPQIIMAAVSVGTRHIGEVGEIRATKNITGYYSDERLKVKVGEIEHALDLVDTLTPFYYHANKTAEELGYDPAVREVGLSAQEVQAIMPEVVAPAPVDPEYLTIRYEKLVPLLIEAIKELRAEVKELKKTIGE